MVLGIENRTENWKTARCLRPFFYERAVCIARKLGEPRATPAAAVSLELYWKGVRDWCKGRNKPQREAQLVGSCRKLFPDLRQRIKGYGHFRDLSDGNYEVLSDLHRSQLVTNLVNTEIDIVLETPGRLYIGEAKSESSFHASGKLVLVHQLVRQYVMASVLVDVLQSSREVVPFVVVNGTWEPRSRQVQFMIAQRWLRKENCLTWCVLEAMA